LAALAWAVLRSVLEVGVGLLALAAFAGWAIGATMRSVSAPTWLAVSLAGLAWLLGLVASWLTSMAVLAGSSRTLVERLEATPFLAWLGPQFGWLEVASLALYVGAAAYGARPSTRGER
jgi:hypothetical protein